MSSYRPTPPVLARASYAVLRYEGVPPPRAGADLGLTDRRAAKLERLFLARSYGGAHAMRPRFARHHDHVRAALAAGGFPALRLR
ncbi:MAG: hypothetical protein ACJ798_15005 [Phenylobacterium sp.]